MENKTIGMMGCGKLGLPIALAIESRGFDIAGYDINLDLIQKIEDKDINFADGKEELKQSKIRMLPLSDFVKESDIIFAAVQTPHEKEYEGITFLPETRKDFDYTFLKTAISAIVREVEMQEIAEKHVNIVSTVLPGTIDREIRPLLNDKVKLTYNPSFCAMNTVIEDFLVPEFVLIGSDNEIVSKKIKSIYRTIHNISDKNFYCCSIKEAELIKVAYNVFIGQKIVFANTLLEICYKMNMNVDTITNALKLADKRLISPAYMSGGMGDGGGCHPRDAMALSWLAKDLNLSFDLPESIMIAREKQTAWLADLIIAEYEKSGLKDIIILGKAYKRNVNLTDGSSSVLLKNILAEKGYIMNVKMYDPFINSFPFVQENPAVIFMGTKHDIFTEYIFSKGSIVIDPFRYIKDQDGTAVIRIGEPEVFLF